MDEVVQAKRNVLIRQWDRFLPEVERPSGLAQGPPMKGGPGWQELQRSQGLQGLQAKGVHADWYHLISGDLRYFETQVVAQWNEIGFEVEYVFFLNIPNCFIFHKSLPTLWLSECVLVYLAPTYADTLMQWITMHQPHTVFITYEQIRPDDTFGQMMMRNLQVGHTHFIEEGIFIYD